MCESTSTFLTLLLTSSRPIGLAGITDTFAASLWTLNFFLYAASIGIAQGKVSTRQHSLNLLTRDFCEVNMHMTYDVSTDCT